MEAIHHGQGILAELARKAGRRRMTEPHQTLVLVVDALEPLEVGSDK